MYVPMCVPVCVCVCVCVSLLSPWPRPNCGAEQQNPPTPPHDPSPPFPHPYPQAIARPTPGKNYPLKSPRSSRNPETDFWNAKFHSWNGISRLEQYENHNSENSRSNSRSHSRKWWEPTWKISFDPAFSECFFKNWGGPRAPELRSLDSSSPFSQAIVVVGDNEHKCSVCYDRKAKRAFRSSNCCNH